MKLGRLSLQNPVMPASGTYEYGIHGMGIYDTAQLGAIVLKSVCYEKRPGNPMPRIHELPYGMINAVGIPSARLADYLEHNLPAHYDCPVPLVFSLIGHTAEDYYQSVKMLAENPHIAAIELNLSCPNVGSGLPFSANTRILRETLGPLMGLTEIPLFAKLSPMAENISDIAKAAEDCGMTAITLANTFPAMVIDINTQRPVLGNKGGGMSGPCIKPMVMNIVYSVYRAVGIPIIACGGISCAADAIEFMLAGATAVQIGSANFSNPRIMPEVISGLSQYLQDHDLTSARQLIGLAH